MKRRILSLITAVSMIISSIVLSQTASAATAATKLQLGDYMQMGKFNIKNRTGTYGYNLTTGPYAPEASTYPDSSSDTNRPKYGSNYRETSSLKKWLNSEEQTVEYPYGTPRPTDSSGNLTYGVYAGFLTNFTDEEKAAIVKDVTQRTVVSSKYESERDGGSEGYVYGVGVTSTDTSKKYALQNCNTTAYYKNTTDSVFVLDIPQILQVKENLKNNEYIVNGNTYHWLRCARANISSGARRVTYSGSIEGESAYTKRGVCPAFFLDSASVLFTSGDGTSDSPYTVRHRHTLYNNADCTDTSHDQTKYTFTKWTATDSLPTEAGNYYLTADVTLSETWNVPSGTTNLCLNGRSITQTGNDAVITINSGGTLNLCDCSETPGQITHGSGKLGHGVNITSGGTFNMYGGSVTGNTADFGGGVYNSSSSGTFTMSGGSVANNTTTSSGGGVYNQNGTFTMSGGSVTGNTANASGGGVYIDNGTFTMSGGSVTGNYAKSTNTGGGGVYNNGTFTMSGGSVTGNNATTKGGGVYNHQNGTFTMSGGSVTGNNATTKGGGVYNRQNGTFNMSGGSVTDNTATYSGGGVYNNGTFNMSGNPTISGNKLNDAANNVYLNGSKVITIAGKLTYSTPIGVSVSTTNGKVFTSGWSKNMNGKTITDYFTSDNSALTLGTRTTGDATEGILGYKDFTMSFKKIAKKLKIC